jgi:hypothetical protein
VGTEDRAAHRAFAPPGEIDEVRLGRVELAPAESIAAGSLGTWTLTYRAGSIGIDEDGAIKIAFPFVSDWGVPQFSSPSEPNFASVVTSGRARVEAHYDPHAHVRPWQRAIVVRVRDGFLSPGDTVTLTLGDKSHGSPGATAQSFCVEGFRFVTVVDAFGTGIFTEVPIVGELDIVPAALSQLVAIAPSEGVVGVPFEVFVKGQDSWGNPTGDFGDNLSVSGEGLELLDQQRHGLMVLVVVRPIQAGICRVRVKDLSTGLEAVANPTVVHLKRASVRGYWGDLHGQSGETIGTKRVDEYLAFARDIARLDFFCHQANDFQITAEIWSKITAAIKEFHSPGRFVPFNGYEWSGLTCAGGDRNVIFRGDEATLRRSGHWQISDLSDADSDCYPLTELYEAFRGRDDVLLIPHVGGRYANMAFHDPDLEPAVEILSTHGQFEWLYTDALAAGCRVGVTCGSDDHTGRPGASYPGGAGLGLKGGLLCLLATGLTREELWQALRSRSCYGTTGERIVLSVQCNGVGIGGEVVCGEAPRFEVRVNGTAPIEAIELRVGARVVDRFPRNARVERDRSRLRLLWRGARHRGRGRAARWDGYVEVSGTSIEDVSEVMFDMPREGVTAWNQKVVRWRSTTRGDCDGVVLTLKEPRGRVEFHTEILSFGVDLSELTGCHEVYGGGMDLRASVEWLPKEGGLDTEAVLLGEVPSDAELPYQVVVMQVDGSKAWASPIWVSGQGVV